MGWEPFVLECLEVVIGEYYDFSSFEKHGNEIV